MTGPDTGGDLQTAPPRTRTGWQTLVVRQLRLEADGVVSVTLARPDGAALDSWAPGAHLDIELHDGLVRQYSLCGETGREAEWTVAVRAVQTSRGGSSFVHESLRVGHRVRVSAPRQKFPLERSPRYLFVAGGIGITPLLPMIEELAGTGATWTVHYAGRSRSAMAYLDRLARAATGAGHTVVLHPRDSGPRLDLDAVVDDAGDDEATLVYVCGPAGMIRAARQLVPAARLRTESFDPAPDPEPVPVTTSLLVDISEKPGAADRPFEVQLGVEGAVLTVPAGVPALDVLNEAGADLPWSCREGTCGTCETGVLDGAVDHRDHVLTDAERAAHDCFFPCVSRACGTRLILDL
ncbi:PDR/VanB family oxidoreductase [Nakamurella deserti]|uniref:PDR/VanB family oxidoreductase n=1 Tax=Nakamurella deserti TaxID=2164074 RepID=UPI000DBE251D|nr:PDR/VanB family oxidoreductase [Nakamurella deserti]